MVSEIALHSQGDTAGRQPRRLHSNARRSGRQGHLVDLSIDASDPNDDPLTYIWRAANGSFNGGVRTNQTTWDAAGLSPGHYTVTVTVAERITGGQERSVNVNVARYAAPVQGVCTPDSGWENGTLFPMIGGSVLRSVPRHPYQQLPMVHDGSRRTWRSEVNHVGGGNSICGVAAGVCKEREDPWNSSYDPDDPSTTPTTRPTARTTTTGTATSTSGSTYTR